MSLETISQKIDKVINTNPKGNICQITNGDLEKYQGVNVRITGSDNFCAEGRLCKFWFAQAYYVDKMTRTLRQGDVLEINGNKFQIYN